MLTLHAQHVLSDPSVIHYNFVKMNNLPVVHLRQLHGSFVSTFLLRL